MVIHGCTHQWFSSNTRRTGRGENTDRCPLESKLAHHHIVCEPQEESDNFGENEEYHPIPNRRLHRSAVFGSKENKVVHKSMWKMETETNWQLIHWSTSKSIFKRVYMKSLMPNVIHSMKWVWLTLWLCKKRWIKWQQKMHRQSKKMAANQLVAAKYHHVIDTVMSMTQATEKTERNDTTIQTQWLAFTANLENQFASTQRRLENGC